MAVSAMVTTTRSARASRDRNRSSPSPPPPVRHVQVINPAHQQQPQRRTTAPNGSPTRPGVRFNPDSDGYGSVGHGPRRSANENGDAGDVVVRSLDEDTSRYWWPSFTQWYSELNKAHAVTIFILFYVNLINYMDRSVVAGMMDSIKNDRAFNKPSDKQLGLLQTVFVIFYMIFAPVFGYLGDRYNRKWILCLGLSIWCFATFIGSFATNFWLFLFFRAVVGIGEASYSTLAPALISDLFSKDSRSRVLALFYFAIPLGIGLGYIIGSEVASCFGDWRWGLRVTPFMGLISFIFIVFFMVDPERGLADGAQVMAPSVSWKDDVKVLYKNKSYFWTTAGFTCVTFSVGALMWWGPTFAFYGAKAECGNRAGCEKITPNDISYRFGIVMAFAGLIGVPFGSTIAQLIRHKVPNADPLVCGTTLLVSVPVMYAGFIAARYNTDWCYGLTFVAGLLLNCNWSVVSDMTLYIVIPPRRSFASATQILMSHLFGDAISPYLVGAVSDAIRESIYPNVHSQITLTDAVITDDSPEYYEAEFRSQQYALFGCCFFQAIGGFFFLMTSWYVLDDKAKADRAISEAEAVASQSDREDTAREETEPLVPGRVRQEIDC